MSERIWSMCEPGEAWLATSLASGMLLRVSGLVSTWRSTPVSRAFQNAIRIVHGPPAAQNLRIVCPEGLDKHACPPLRVIPQNPVPIGFSRKKPHHAQNERPQLPCQPPKQLLPARALTLRPESAV